jgi:hypothetical protein
MSKRYYILDDDGLPIGVDSFLEWATWFEAHNRCVAKYERNGYCVSTVFLGLDHQFGKGPPLIFETMVFDDNHSHEWFGTEHKLDIGHEIECRRYSTRDDAMIGHEKCVRILNESLDKAQQAISDLKTT